jgi:hypothetical protein
MASGRRSIELRRTFLTNTNGEEDQQNGSGSPSLEYSSWESYIASMIAKYRDGIILECLCELFSDEMSSHEALTEGHIGLLFSCLADALEISSDFPITEVRSSISPHPYLHSTHFSPASRSSVVNSYLNFSPSARSHPHSILISSNSSPIFSPSLGINSRRNMTSSPKNSWTTVFSSPRSP